MSKAFESKIIDGKEYILIYSAGRELNSSPDIVRSLYNSGKIKGVKECQKGQIYLLLDDVLELKKKHNEIKTNYYSTDEIQKLLNCSFSNTWNLINKMRFTKIQFSNQFFIPREELDGYLMELEDLKQNYYHYRRSGRTMELQYKNSEKVCKSQVYYS